MTKLLDLNVTQSALYFNVKGGSAFTLQTLLVSGTWATAVVTVNRSANGLDWYAMPQALVFPAGGGMTEETQVVGFDWIRAQVTTNEGAAGVAAFTLGIA